MTLFSLMPGNERLAAASAAQVEKAILQPQVFVGQLVAELGDLEGRRRTAVQDLYLFGLDLDVSGGKFRVCLSLRAVQNLAPSRQDKFSTNLFAEGDNGGVVGFENDLSEAVAIAKIDEHLIVIARKVLTQPLSTTVWPM